MIILEHDEDRFGLVPVFRDRLQSTLCGHSDRSPSHVGIGAAGLRPDLAGISIEIHRQGSRRITTNLSVGIVAGLNRGLA